MHHKIMIL